MYLKKQQQNKAKNEKKKKKKRKEERQREKKKGYLAGFEPCTIGSTRLHFTTTWAPQRMKKSILSKGLAFPIEL